jgi:hypothetical protein
MKNLDPLRKNLNEFESLIFRMHAWGTKIEVDEDKVDLDYTAEDEE